MGFERAFGRFAGLLLALALTGSASAQQGEALLIQDSAAWGYDAWNAELTLAGINYTQIGSADLAAENLNQYDMVVTVSVSGGTYNQRLMQKTAEFESFVQQGGVLIWSGCTQSGETPYPDPPFGGTNEYGTDSNNVIADAAHPLMDGVVPPVSGSSASHNYFANVPVGAEIQLTHSQNGNPVLYTLYEGNGLLIATGATWEFGWNAGWENAKILVNAIDWGWAFDPCMGNDNDGDGWTDCDHDCDDNDPTIHPGAVEICDDGIDQNCDQQVDEYADEDGDGYTNCDGDCNDYEALAYPGSTEVCDFVDNDCDGLIDEGFDQDGDGWTTCEGDCDDSDAQIYPGAPEQCDEDDDDCDEDVHEQTDDDNDGWTICQGDCNDNDGDTFPGAPELCDEVDNDCDEVVPANETYDGDGDGWVECLDCNDADAAIYPGQQEICDGIDNNCDGDADEGLDGDGDDISVCEGDCDDTDPTVYPGAPEICDEKDNDCDEALAEYEFDNDGVDSDCAGDLQVTEIDDDGDGYSECAGDCEDDNATTYPGAPELCNGLHDDDCNPATDELADTDLDGFNICQGDCDDLNENANPAEDEVCDGVDNDCDDLIDEDLDYDHDGYTGCGGEDCNDNNPGVYPGAPETPYDGIDQDCDDADLTDVDGDGVDGGPYGTDCDDTDAERYPGAEEDCEDGIDGDCDGVGDAYDDDCGFEGDEQGDDDDCSCDVDARPSTASPLGLMALLGLLALRRRR